MQIIEADFIDEDQDGNELDKPYYILEDGRQVTDANVFYADWKDTSGQHESIIRAAKAGKGKVVQLDLRSDGYYFCNSSKLYRPRKRAA
jgi:hypothetical protein